MVIRCYKSYIAYKLYVLGIMMTQNRDTHVQTSMMRWDRGISKCPIHCRSNWGTSPSALDGVIFGCLKPSTSAPVFDPGGDVRF